MADRPQRVKDSLREYVDDSTKSKLDVEGNEERIKQILSTVKNEMMQDVLPDLFLIDKEIIQKKQAIILRFILKQNSRSDTTPEDDQADVTESPANELLVDEDSSEQYADTVMPDAPTPQPENIDVTTSMETTGHGENVADFDNNVPPLQDNATGQNTVLSDINEENDVVVDEVSTADQVISPKEDLVVHVNEEQNIPENNADDMLLDHASVNENPLGQQDTITPPEEDIEMEDVNEVPSITNERHEDREFQLSENESDDGDDGAGDGDDDAEIKDELDSLVSSQSEDIEIKRESEDDNYGESPQPESSDELEEESGYETDAHEVHPGEAYIRVGNDNIAIWEYLGMEWSQFIRTLHNVPSIQQPDWCLTELRPWQLTGVAKLLHLAESPFRGGILGDEQGLGKTLTALAFMIYQEKSNPYQGYTGFSLIITTKTCAPQWKDEIRSHFGNEAYESTLILDDPNISLNEILDRKYKFVLCTYQFVASRWRAMRKTVMFFEYVRHCGIKTALEKVSEHERPDLMRCPTNALFTPAYGLLQMPIKNVILDEAQYIKNPDSITNRAIRDLTYDRIWMLSGTFLANRWHDIYGLISLIPGHPWTNLDQFQMTFARKDGNTGIFMEPSVSKRNRLIKFLQAITISRPASLLRLNGLNIEYCDFQVDEFAEAIIAHYTKLFVETIRGKGQGRIYSGDLSHNDNKAKALIYATRAQQYCGNPHLIKGYEPNTEEVLRASGVRALEQFIFRNGNDYNEEQLIQAFSEFAKKVTGKIARNKSHVPAADNETDPNEDDDIDADPDYDPNADDPDYDPGADPEYDADQPEAVAEFEKDLQAAQQEVEAEVLEIPTEDRQQWLKRVRKFGNNFVLSPKINKLLVLLQRIHQTFPNERVVVFSKFLKFLDLVEEAIRRDPYMDANKISALRFDGTLSTEERNRVRGEYGKSVGSSVILVSAKAGGAGMNLTAGSQIIQCEPWWSKTDEDQAYSRCWRMGQVKTVHVYILRGINSAIDYVLHETRDRKEKVNIEIMRPLRHTDDAELIIPEQSKGGVGE